MSQLNNLFLYSSTAVILQTEVYFTKKLPNENDCSFDQSRIIIINLRRTKYFANIYKVIFMHGVLPKQKINHETIFSLTIQMIIFIPR